MSQTSDTEPPSAADGIIRTVPKADREKRRSSDTELTMSAGPAATARSSLRHSVGDMSDAVAQLARRVELVDTTADGRPDTLAVDTSGDGQADTLIELSGTPSFAAGDVASAASRANFIDTTGDGLLSKVELTHAAFLHFWKPVVGAPSAAAKRAPPGASTSGQRAKASRTAAAG